MDFQLVTSYRRIFATYLQGCLYAYKQQQPALISYFARRQHMLPVYTLLLSQTCEGSQWGASSRG